MQNGWDALTWYQSTSDPTPLPLLQLFHCFCHGKSVGFLFLQSVRQPRRTYSPVASTLVLLNIPNHVPVVLSADDGNFKQWHNFFKLTFQKFGLVNHIDGTVDAAVTMIDNLE
jgi:hypothetical protein